MDNLPTGSDFGQLRAFVAICETLSFSRAAALLGVSPSALSQTMRGLEGRVGVRLLNRTTRSVSLTEAGRSLFQRVAPAVAELGAAMGQARGYGDRPSGTVRVHAFHSAAERLILPMLAGFHRDYPQVVVDLVLDDAVTDMVAGGYDLALRIGEVIERDMVAAPLGPELRQIAVAAPAYLEAHGQPEHPRDLVRHRCIRWRWPGQAAPYSWEFFEAGAWFEVTVDGPLIVNSKAAGVRAALDGIGIAFAAAHQVEEPLRDGRLVALLEPWCAPFPGYHLCYPRQRQMAPAVRAFIDRLRSRPWGQGSVQQVQGR
ncbi:MAG: LysR family transcriptional regulator [Caulobacteraceae bacterium]|nr:LysR family transcriptional regulator [Caulobacteraceae bacterium]